MDYIRPKLQINRYKKDSPHILFRRLAIEVDRETQMKLNFSLGYELALWLVRLMSFNPSYNVGTRRLFERDAVDALIIDYLQIVSGKIVENNSFNIDNLNEQIYTIYIQLAGIGRILHGSHHKFIFGFHFVSIFCGDMMMTRAL